MEREKEGITAEGENQRHSKLLTISWNPLQCLPLKLNECAATKMLVFSHGEEIIIIFGKVIGSMERKEQTFVTPDQTETINTEFLSISPRLLCDNHVGISHNKEEHPIG